MVKQKLQKRVFFRKWHFLLLFTLSGQHFDTLTLGKIFFMSNSFLKSLSFWTIQSTKDCLFDKFIPQMIVFLNNSFHKWLSFSTIQSTKDCLFDQFNPQMIVFLINSIHKWLSFWSIQSTNDCLFDQFNPQMIDFEKDFGWIHSTKDWQRQSF